MAKKQTNHTDEIDQTAFARIGAEVEYYKMLKRMTKMRKAFPGVHKVAELKLQQEQAAHARLFKGKRRRSPNGSHSKPEPIAAQA
jgi:hypothetical protein